MKNQVLVLLFAFTNIMCKKKVTAHSSLDPTSYLDHSHCPCYCRTNANALRSAMEECSMYSHETCRISFCLLQNRPGFSCCDEDVPLPDFDKFNLEFEDAPSASADYLFGDDPVSESTEEYSSQEYHETESPHLEPTQDVHENHEKEAASAKPCESLTMSPMKTVTPTMTPSQSASPSVTASRSPTRTPSNSPSPTLSPSVSPSPSPEFATLHYAADNEAFVYVNGNLISALTNWRLFETVSFPLKRSDVVAILARDNGGWYGLIAALQVGDRWYVTGTDEWKAIKAFKVPGDDELWTVPFFNTCSWLRVEARPNADVIFNGKAPTFPYETGAQYVWADDAGENDSIYVRFVLGGEDCS